MRFFVSIYSKPNTQNAYNRKKPNQTTQNRPAARGGVKCLLNFVYNFYYIAPLIENFYTTISKDLTILIHFCIIQYVFVFHSRNSRRKIPPITPDSRGNEWYSRWFCYSVSSVSELIVDSRFCSAAMYLCLISSAE